MLKSVDCTLKGSIRRTIGAELGAVCYSREIPGNLQNNRMSSHKGVTFFAFKIKKNRVVCRNKKIILIFAFCMDIKGSIKSKSIVKQLETVLREQWDRDALTDSGQDVTYKYGDVAIRICYLHMLFESLGIKPGDKVAICDKNSSNWAIAMLAVLTYRTVAVPLLSDYSKQQLRMPL